jgi:hypothetical protein
MPYASAEKKKEENDPSFSHTTCTYRRGRRATGGHPF